MSRELAGVVSVLGPDGRRQAFGPGEAVPDWAAEQITNPAAWVQPPAVLEDDDLDDAAVLNGPPVPPGGGGEPSDEDEGDNDGEEPPPHGGPGSGAAAWRDYASRHDVEVAEDATREDVVEACEQAGVPT